MRLYLVNRLETCSRRGFPRKAWGISRESNFPTRLIQRKITFQPTNPSRLGTAKPLQWGSICCAAELKLSSFEVRVQVFVYLRKGEQLKGVKCLDLSKFFGLIKENVEQRSNFTSFLRVHTPADSLNLTLDVAPYCAEVRLSALAWQVLLRFVRPAGMIYVQFYCAVSGLFPSIRAELRATVHLFLFFFFFVPPR